jgi:hypothetical protein
MNQEQAQQLALTIQTLQQQIQAQQQQLASLQQQPTSSSSPSLTLKPPRPSLFTGNNMNATTTIDSWLFELDNYFGVMNVTDVQKVAYAVSCLRENATIWWRNTLQTMTTTEQQNITYAQFQQLMRDNYQPVAAAETARSALHRIRQTGGVQAYNALYLRYMNMITDMSSADQQYLYKQGLQPHIAREVSIHRPKTLTECMNIAQRAEIEQRNFRTRNPIQMQSGGINGGGYSAYPIGTRSSNGNATPMELALMAVQQVLQQTKQQDHHDYTQSEPEQPADVSINATNMQTYQRANQNPTTFRPMLNPEQRKEYMQKGWCFRCKQPGHLSRQCPSKNGQRQQ